MATSRASATKKRAASPNRIIKEIRNGFGWERVERFQTHYGLKDERVARIIGLSDRTLTRHRKKREPLDSVASDRFYRAERILEFATSVFEDKEEAMRWLRRPQPGLSNMIPLEILDTEPGSHAVQTLLTQIEYGVLP
jgi:putative toxin-antitoxin system antitoxin component (TIGR02293 family)